MRRFALSHGISAFTVAQAYGRLCGLGLVESRERAGVFVKAQPVRRRETVTASPIDLSWLLRSTLDDGGAPRGPGVGVLPPGWLNADEIGRALRSIAREGDGRWLERGNTRGYGPLISLLAARMRAADVPASESNLLLTTGVTQGLNLCLRALIERDQTVLVVEPYWFTGLGVLCAAGVRVASFPLSPTGLDLERLEATLSKLRPRLLVLMSGGHNPTGLSLSSEECLAVARLAEKYRFWVFEDDVVGDLCAARARIAAADGLSRVIHASSFAKTFADNLRVGYLAASAPLTERLSQHKILSGFTTPTLNERLVHRLLASGVLKRCAAELKARAEEARTAAVRRFEELGLETFGKPTAGYFVWVKMRIDANVAALRARDQGWTLAPGSLFHVDGRATPWTRVNIAAPDEPEWLKFLTARR